MKKYWLSVKLYWDTMMTYRADMLLWRLRNFLTSIMSLTLWTTIFASTNSAFGYDRDQMITYIFLAAFLQSAIMSTSLNGLSGTIYRGGLSQLLLQPVNIYAVLATGEIADKLYNVIFLLIETGILFLIFKPDFAIPGPLTLLLFVLWTLGGVAINYLISLLFGSFGFWSPDSWGPKFLFYLVVSFSAGKLYPLNILPSIIQTIIYLTPFPYYAFLQSQLFLGKLNSGEILFNSIVLLFWIFVLSLIVKFVWSKGIKNYSAVGQ